jgi:hypothetical protein
VDKIRRRNGGISGGLGVRKNLDFMRQIRSKTEVPPLAPLVGSTPESKHRQAYPLTRVRGFALENADFEIF